jgi:hypothetical protein
MRSSDEKEVKKLWYDTSWKPKRYSAANANPATSTPNLRT